MNKINQRIAELERVLNYRNSDLRRYKEAYEGMCEHAAELEAKLAEATSRTAIYASLKKHIPRFEHEIKGSYLYIADHDALWHSACKISKELLNSDAALEDKDE